MLVKITLFAALLLSIVVPFAYFLSGTKNKARYKLTIGTNAAAFFRALRDAQPDRTGNRQTEQFVPEPLAQLRKDDGKSFPNTGIVTNIGRKTNVVVVVQYDDLERRGTHIKTYSIVFHNKTIFHQHCLTIMSDTNVNKNSDMVNRNENYLQFFQRPVVRSVIPKIYTNGRPIQKRYPPQMQRVSPVFRQCQKPPSVKL